MFICIDRPTSLIYTLSLHDALPISMAWIGPVRIRQPTMSPASDITTMEMELYRMSLQGSSDRKSTRLNSSHRCISYAVFCLKKKKQQEEKTSKKRTHQKLQFYILSS